MALHYITGQQPETNSPKNNNIINNNDVLTILVHGGALSSRMYRTLTPYLASPWVAVDLPGHGKSVQLGPFTFARSTELLKRLIEDHLQQQQHRRIALVGISLGGQAVLDLVLTYPRLVHTAIVSGVSIHPPDANAAWEMPHMPTEQAWLDGMAEDVAVIGGMDAATAIQAESFAFSIGERQAAAAADDCCYPPVLVCVGEHDVAMAKRDFPDLVTQLKALNPASEGRVLEGAFHNHSIDVPELFAEVVSEWIAKVS